jgi:hypothetical protein
MVSIMGAAIRFLPDVPVILGMANFLNYSERAMQTPKPD